MRSEPSAPPAATEQRAKELFKKHRRDVFVRADRIFFWVLAAEWSAAVVAALVLSPYGWQGRMRTTHVHVYAAVFLGGLLSSLPMVLTRTRPGGIVTRHVVAVAQVLWSALLIHLTGGRIETHFHVFGSLAFLAIYRDYTLLASATVVVTVDHLLRGIFWPESVYGIANPESWRFLEHVFWVAFEDIVLVIACIEGMKEMRAMAQRRAEIEALSASEREKSAALDEALRELQRSHEALVRAEKLAALGQLAATLGHELRNPLAAIRMAGTYIRTRLGAGEGGDANVPRFLEVIDNEVETCARIISDLLDFARERPPQPRPCPLRQLVDEAAGLVLGARERIINAVPEDLPPPSLDKEQFRRVLINLMQNAIEAISERSEGDVTVSAEGGGGRPWRIRVDDEGTGIPADVVSRIFEPLFTTKAKGTGLGLAIVANMVKGHGGSVRAEGVDGGGTSFVIELPASTDAGKASISGA